MQQSPFEKKGATISNQNDKLLEDSLALLMPPFACTAGLCLVLHGNFVHLGLTKTSKLCIFWVETDMMLPFTFESFAVSNQIQHPSALQPSCRALHLLRRKVLHRDAASDMLAMPGFRTKSERCRIAALGTRYVVKVLNFLAFIKKDISDYHEHLFCKVTWSAE